MLPAQPRGRRRGGHGPRVDRRVDPADQLSAAQNREDVVAELAFRQGDVHLEPVAEAEELRRALTVVDEPVEGREEDRAGLAPAALEHAAVHPAVAVEPRDARAPRSRPGRASEGRVGARRDAVELQPELRRRAMPLRRGHLDDRTGDLAWGPSRLVARQPPLGGVPDALVAVAADNRDLAAEPEDVEHAADGLAVVPASRLPRHRSAVIEVARQQRAHGDGSHRGCNGGTRRWPSATRGCTARARQVAAGYRRRLAMDAVVRRRDDVRPVLEDLAAIERGGELCRVVGPVG